MNVLSYRDPPPLESPEDYRCPVCGELYPYCECDLPTYGEVRDHPSQYLHEHAGAVK